MKLQALNFSLSSDGFYLNWDLDDHESSATRRLEIVKILKHYKENSDSLQLISITPFTNILNKTSLFAKKLS